MAHDYHHSIHYTNTTHKQIHCIITISDNHFIPRVCSISTRKFSFITPFSTSTTLYFSRVPTRSGQWRNTCSIVCIPVLHLHKRSSRGIYGVLPVSILRLCEPDRYRVMHTRWNSSFPWYHARMVFVRFGLIVIYVPSLESLSFSAAIRVFSSVWKYF